MWEAAVLTTNIFTYYGTITILQGNFVCIEDGNKKSSQNTQKLYHLT